MNKSRRSRMFFKLIILKNFAIFTGKHLCKSQFFIKLQTWKIKKRLQHRCFPVSIVKILYRTHLVAATVWNWTILFFTLTLFHNSSFCIFLMTWIIYTRFLLNRNQLTNWQCQSFEWFLFNTTFYCKKDLFE